MKGNQEAKVFAERITIDARMGYLLSLPDGYGKGKEAWPLVLFLHGAGERGTDIELVKKHGPPRRVEEGERFPFMLVSPQCPADEYWSVPILKALLDRILEQCRVDRSRIYITGLSMGGNGTWRMAAGGNVRFTAYIDAEHDSWTQTYKNPEFYEWLFGQKRK